MGKGNTGPDARHPGDMTKKRTSFGPVKPVSLGSKFHNSTGMVSETRTAGKPKTAMNPPKGGSCGY